jgi:hypothetical protein
VVVAAVDGAGNRTMRKKLMRSRTTNTSLRTKLILSATTLVALLILTCQISGQEPASTATPAQESFASPQLAAAALIQAAGKFDVPALERVLGPGSEALVASQDAVLDKNNAVAFAAKAQGKNSVSINPKNPSRATLLAGDDNWPLPIPIVKRNGKWLFDTKAGLKEVLYRRIGSNELDALQICRAYDDAQFEYALTKHDNSEVNQYAQRVISTPGKRDGLVWRNADGSLGGPVSEAIADAIQQGYTDKAKPYHGYFFKILKGQGPAAPLGAMNFVVEGAMIGGFALAAAPADYRISGVKTFIVGYQGVVYQKDLGPDTLKIFQEMELYNPDKSWQPTNDSWPADVLDESASAAQN